jgi:hypothetical protein
MNKPAEPQQPLARKPPRAVLTAVTLMYVQAALTLVLLPLNLTRLPALRAELPATSLSPNSLLSLIAIALIVLTLGWASLWFHLASVCRKGHAGPVSPRPCSPALSS